MGIPSTLENLGTWGTWMAGIMRHVAYFWGLYVAGGILLWPFARDAVNEWRTRGAAELAAARATIRVLAPVPKEKLLDRNHHCGVWIDDHPVDLMVRLSGLSHAQAHALAAPFTGKTSALEGIVGNLEIVNIGEKVDQRRYIITLQSPQSYRVMLEFEWWWDGHVAHLVPGKRIQFVGDIAQLSSSEIRYTKCEPIRPLC